MLCCLVMVFYRCYCRLVLSDVEILKYVVDDDFVTGYSVIFQLVDVFEWTCIHKLYA